MLHFDVFRVCRNFCPNDMSEINAWMQKMMPYQTWGHPSSAYAKFSEKLTQVRVRIRGLEMLVFWKILRTYFIKQKFNVPVFYFVDLNNHNICKVRFKAHYLQNPSTQLIFTCSKSTIETLEKGVKYVQS